jgi:hypothetical protein
MNSAADLFTPCRRVSVCPLRPEELSIIFLIPRIALFDEGLKFGNDMPGG